MIPAGRMSNVGPGDIVGAITGESKLSGSVVGDIHILERVTFVSVPESHAEQILEALDGTRIRGRVIRPRLADGTKQSERQTRHKPPFRSQGGKRKAGYPKGKNKGKKDWKKGSKADSKPDPSTDAKGD